MSFVGGFNCADWEVHLSDEATTMSLRGLVLTLTASAEGASLMERDGTDGRKSKVYFNFLHTLWEYR